MWQKKENDMVWLITTCTHTRVCSSTVTYSHDQVSTEQWFHAQKQQPPSVAWSQNLAPCVWGKSHENLKSVNRSLFFLMVFLEQIKTLTWHWRQHCYPAGTWPSVGGLCLCSGTERSSLESPSTPNQPLAFWVLKWKKKRRKEKKCWMFTIKFKAQKECWI